MSSYKSIDRYEGLDLGIKKLLREGRMVYGRFTIYDHFYSEDKVVYGYLKDYTAKYVQTKDNPEHLELLRTYIDDNDEFYSGFIPELEKE